ncbi:MAG TPA: hypothetical protein VE666_07350 [Mycobacterium sp.]|nr:hypothetical protein [Mycobacterium sp.]
MTAAPALGAIPLAFIRNQFQYCSLICPFALQAAITVPIAAAQTPVTFLGSLASTGNIFKAVGAAAASVTGPANSNVTTLINNDVFLVVPKAFHALDVAVVEGFNVGAAILTPGDFLGAVQNARTNILGALNQPVGTPTTPTGATNIFQVVAVSAIDVTTAVAFQAGELLLAGVVQVADAAAQELAQSGNPAAALAAGATRAGQVIGEASAPVASAVNTAVTNIRNSLQDPFPSKAPALPVKTTAPSAETVAVTDEPKSSETPTTKKPGTATATKASSEPPTTKKPDTPTATKTSSEAPTSKKSSGGSSDITGAGNASNEGTSHKATSKLKPDNAVSVGHQRRGRH